MQSNTITVPKLIADYALERGYVGAPRISATYFDGEWHYASAGSLMTVETRKLMSAQRVERVCVIWDRAGVAGISADFTLSEIEPMTGLRGNPNAAGVEIEI